MTNSVPLKLAKTRRPYISGPVDTLSRLRNCSAKVGNDLSGTIFSRDLLLTLSALFFIGFICLILFIRQRLLMARNRDLNDIQDGHSRVRQTRFEYRQSCRAGVRIYCPFRVHRFKWPAGCRDPGARLASHPSAYLFLGVMSEIGFILSARKTRSG
jgi:hypothetical protein